jgi:hypothetical protein
MQRTTRHIGTCSFQGNHPSPITTLDPIIGKIAARCTGLLLCLVLDECISMSENSQHQVGHLQLDLLAFGSHVNRYNCVSLSAFALCICLGPSCLTAFDFNRPQLAYATYVNVYVERGKKRHMSIHGHGTLDYCSLFLIRYHPPWGDEPGGFPPCPWATRIAWLTISVSKPVCRSMLHERNIGSLS